MGISVFEQAKESGAAVGTVGAVGDGVRALDFLVSIDDTERERSAAVGEKGLFGRRDGAPGEASVRSIPVSVLRENLQRTVDGLQAVLGELRVPEGGMPLKQAQVAFEVTASGGITLVGTSAQVAAKGAITLTFGS
ncbi:Pepco domain-containing protein [Kitasatospora sp. NBC_00458]|uniref:Pepco domain-containing protein n=1 Tax=Kitasatospora sp. NBC_00458 TaxID=2903568 RepID=UPI002E19AB29